MSDDCFNLPFYLFPFPYIESISQIKCFLFSTYSNSAKWFNENHHLETHFGMSHGIDFFWEPKRKEVDVNWSRIEGSHYLEQIEN